MPFVGTDLWFAVRTFGNNERNQMPYRTIMREEMHRSVSSGETDIRIIFAVRVGLLVFHSLVPDLAWPPFGKALPLYLNPLARPLHIDKAGPD